MSKNKGFFLHDFFGRILPGDRNLFTPILEFLKWRRLTQNLGLLSWVALWLAACGLLSFSFVQNLSVLKGFTEEFSKPPALTESISDNLIMMDTFRNELLDLQRANSNWWVPRFGLHESIEVEKKLRKQFMDLFEKGFLHPMDRAVASELDRITQDTPEREIMVYTEHLVGRIKILKARIKGKLSKQSEDLSNVLPDILILLDRKLLPDKASKFEDLYLFYVRQGISEQTARVKIKEMQTTLVKLIFKKSANFHWLVKWANNDIAIRDITLQDFWGPSDSDKQSSEIFVDGAFTVNGRKRIDEFVEYLEDALPDRVDVSEQRKKFYRWYQKKYYRAWKDFALSFSDGQHNLDGLDEWRSMASEMTTPHNPYFELIKRMQRELKPYTDIGDVPAWATQVMEIQSVIDDAARERGVKKDESVLSKAARKGEKLVHEAVSETRIFKDKKLEEEHIQVVKAFNNYLDELEELLPVSTARSQAYKAASEFFPYSLKPSESKSPFFSACGEIQKIKTYLTSGETDSVSLNLLAGPINFLVFYVSMETACFLQHDWEDIVLGGIQGVAGEKLPTLLFGKEGVVWKFVNGSAVPFLGRNQNGYFAKKVRGVRIPFKKDFFAFVTRGAEVSTSIQSEYKVRVKALPIDVNDGAKKEPYEVSLELQCSRGKSRLENYNYPASLIFAWSPADCGDVTLRIHFEGLTLTKKYSGHNGFPLFLADFKDGSKSFTADDFPESRGILQKMSINEIKVSYEFTDNKPVIQLLSKVPRKVPEVIANCWGR